MANLTRGDEPDGRNRAQEDAEVAPASDYQKAPLRNERSLYLTLSRQAYSLKAVHAASYKFSNEYAVLVDPVGEDRWAVVVIAAQTIDHDQVLMRFLKELGDQQLRVMLEEEFGPLRTLIVAQAFSEGNLLNAAISRDDDHTD